MSKEKQIVLPEEVKQIVLIKSQEDLMQATTVLSKLNQALDFLTEQKEKLTKPINTALKEIRARYKEPETILEAKISEVRRLMTEYQTKQMAIQAKKEEKVAEKLANGDISIEKATDAISKLPAVPSKTETEAGSVKFKPVKKFEVMSIGELPIEYHLANESKIRQAMGEGIELRGVRYYVEQVPYNSR